MRRGARGGLLAVLAVLAIGGAMAVQSTVAAWTDPAHVRATASAGTWIVDGCWVMNAAGNTGKPCTINYAGSSVRGIGDGAPVGKRTVQLYLRFQFGSLQSGEYVRTVVDLRKVVGWPAPWTAWDTPLRGFEPGNFIAQPGVQCSALPMMEARVPSWGGSNTELYAVYYEDRTGQKKLGCG